MILERQVSASTDDCFTYETTIKLDLNMLFFDDCTKYMHAYMRFLNINIPRGAAIQHAYIDLCADAYESGMTDLKIYGIKELNSNTFSTQPDADARLMSEVYVEWIMRDYLNNEFWNLGEWWGHTNDPHDIKDIIQEIVNQGGWVSGNALAIKIENTPLGGQGRTCYSWDYGDHSLAPKLYIEYSVVMGALSVSSTPSGADIFINGEFVATTPRSIELEQGQYNVLLRLAGYQDYSATVDITAGQVTTIDAVLPPLLSPSKVTGLNATNLTESSFKLLWASNPIEEEVTAYRVYLRKAE